MKIWYLLFVLLIAVACNSSSSENNYNQKITELQLTSDAEIQELFIAKESNRQIYFTARVIKVLPDDNEGSKHQKFLVELNSGQTLLIAHNVDLAPRVPNLSVDDEVTIYGEYEWNSRGGVVHWTHHDPSGLHPNGWIEMDGEFYQ